MWYLAGMLCKQRGRSSKESLTRVRVAALLTTGNVVSIRRQPYKILLVDVTLEGAQTVRFPYVPELQLTVR